MRASALAFGALLVAGVSVLACNNAPKTGLKEGSGAYIGSSADLKPDGNPGPKSQMILAGTVIPVDLKTVSKDGHFAIDLVYQDELFEEELYDARPDSFSLVNAAGETYNPPVPLLHFPMHVGDSWNWTGKMVTGPAARDATAVVRTLDGKVDMGGGETADALCVEVDLSIFSGAEEPAARRLAFWFVKGKGLVKREFGLSTSRIPEGAKAPTK